VAGQLIPDGLSLILLQLQNVALLSVEEFKMFCISCLKAQKGLLHLDGNIQQQQITMQQFLNSIFMTYTVFILLSDDDVI
jgi:hypothetical protein